MELDTTIRYFLFPSHLYPLGHFQLAPTHQLLNFLLVSLILYTSFAHVRPPQCDFIFPYEHGRRILLITGMTSQSREALSQQSFLRIKSWS